MYYDNIPVLGFGTAWVQPVANAVVDLLVSEGALVCPKSKLTPLDCIDWIGKQFRFGEAVTRSTNKWVALLARWLLFGVGHCLHKDLLRLVGRILWESRPSWDLLPFLASTWAHILWGPIRLSHTVLKLLHAMVTPMVMAARRWVVPVLRSPSTRHPMYVFFDGGPDAGGRRVGLWAPGLGGCCAVIPDSFCNQQIVELRVLEFAANFILAVGWPAASAVGDNSAVLQMFANAKAGLGLSAQNQVLRRLVFEWSTARVEPCGSLRLIDNCCGDEAPVELAASSIYRRLQDLGLNAVRHVWTLGLPRAEPVRLAAWGGDDCSSEVFGL